MSKTFTTMQLNVGNNVQDTSNPTKLLIKNWLNDKYLDISKRALWGALIVTPNVTTIASVIGRAYYALPSDFDQELFCADVTDGRMLDRFTIGQWWTERYGAYSSGTIDNGTPTRYYIDEVNSYVYVDPPPDAIHQYAFPYKKRITELSDDSDTVLIKDIELAMELGATAEAWAYKRMFQKADYYNTRYELEVAKRIGQERRKINQLYQWISDSFRTNNANFAPFTGWQSYNSL